MNENRGIGLAIALASLGLGIGLGSARAFADAPLSAADIMKKNEAARRVSDNKADATIDTHAADGADHAKQFTWWHKLDTDGSHYQTLTRFHEPAEVRDEAILFLEHGSDNNEVLLYLPTYKKVRRVESQQQSGSFMGSALSYSDIATPHVEDYHYTLLRQEPCPGQAAGAAELCWVIESTPATDSVRERTGYARSISWVRQDNFMDVKGESYDTDGKLFKQVSQSDLHEVDPAGHKWMAFHLEMKNLKTSATTTLDFSKVKVNQGIPDSAFTEASLAK